MITYKELQELCESRQRGNLYHYTDTKSAHNILNGNAIYASEFNEPRSISVTRNKNFHKGSSIKTSKGYRKGGVPTDISFELDGDKISNKKKVKPFNFLGFSGMGKPKYPHDESEEQIHGDLENAKDYIKKIRVHGDIKKEDLENLKKHNIPIEHHPYN